MGWQEIHTDKKITGDIKTNLEIRKVEFRIWCLKGMLEERKGQKVAEFIIGDKLKFERIDLGKLKASRYARVNN